MILGILSCVWFVGWCFFGFNSPAEHPRITEAELGFLQKQVPQRPKKVEIPSSTVPRFFLLFSFQASKDSLEKNSYLPARLWYCNQSCLL